MLVFTEVDPWLAVFGRFHVVLLHLPIGLLPGLALLEFGAVMLRKANPRGPVLTLAVMTALAAGAALASGLVLAGEKTDTELLGQHKIAAIVMTCVCAVLPVLALMHKRTAFRITLLVALGVSVWAGHLGGSLTHKKDFLFKPLERAAARKDKAENGTGDAGNGANAKAESKPIPGAQPVVPIQFAKDIEPIFKRVCTGCHNPEDNEGDLDLTSKNGILCLDRDEDDRVLVAGKPDDSHLLTVCEYPLDDEDHMPPEDEKQLTKQELGALRRWIQEGCKFE